MARRKRMTHRRGPRRYRTMKRRVKRHQGRKRTRVNRMKGGKRRRNTRKQMKGGGSIVAATANLSFALSLGNKNAGSESHWLKKIVDLENPPDEKEFLTRRAKKAMDKIVEKLTNNEIDVIGLQELNNYSQDIDPNSKYLGYKLGSKSHIYNIKPIKKNDSELTSETPKEITLESQVGQSAFSSNTLFMVTFGVDISIPGVFTGIPTVALIFNTRKFGKPKYFYVSDCCIPGMKDSKKFYEHGRPMLGAVTDKKYILISMHAANINPFWGATNGLPKFLKENAEGGYPNNRIEENMKEIRAHFNEKVANKIKAFIHKCKKHSGEDSKIILMGDMNDAFPQGSDSISKQLKDNCKLSVAIPDEGTCCPNTDSSKPVPEKNQKRWPLINDEEEAEYGTKPPHSKLYYPHITEEAYKKENFLFKGDLIYTKNMNSEDSQTELLHTPSDMKHKYKGVPYYSDHIFQQRVVEQ